MNNDNETTNTLPLLRPEWLSYMTDRAIHFRGTESYSLLLFYANPDDIWWSVSYNKEDYRTERIEWRGVGTLEEAYSIAYYSFRENDVTDKSVEAVIRDARFLAVTERVPVRA